MSKTFALLIGVQDYALLDRSTHHPQGSRDLSGALNDLSSMAMLVRMMGVEASHVRILSTPRMGPNDFAAVAMGRDPIQNMNMADAAFGFADKQSIVDGLTWLADQLQAHRDAQAIVYFSGHTVVTQAGHPCLAAADTQRQHPQAGGEDVADPRAVQTYLERSDLLCALDEVLGTSDPALMTRLVTALCDKPAELRRRPRARVAECARDLGKPPTRKGLSRFTEALANVGDDVRGAAKRARISQTLSKLPEMNLTEGIIASVLQGDPFADCAEHRGLISFNRAFYNALRDVPEDRSVHILLETCIDGGTTGLNPWYAQCGLPLAHGNIVLMGSCQLNQSSNLAVFDNRWHGAFTWGLVNLLGQTAVHVAKEGRSFATTYAALAQRTGALLELMGFSDQQPSLWSQPDQANWEVFGTLPGTWTDVAVLEPVRTKEEINAGDGGHIYELMDGTVSKGWLVVTGDGGMVFGGQSLTPNHEYWFWTGTAFQGNFDVVSRTTGPAVVSGQVKKTPSEAFSDNAEPLEGGHWAVSRVPPTGPTTPVCCVCPQPPSPASQPPLDIQGLLWATPDEPGPKRRVTFTTEPGAVTRFVWQPGPPPGELPWTAHDSFGG